MFFLKEKKQISAEVKSKNRVNCIDCFDLDNDGVPELIAGWENGKVEVRNEKTGEVSTQCSLMFDHFSSFSMVIYGLIELF